MGECGNMAAVTYGQRASIGGNSDRCFAVLQMHDRQSCTTIFYVGFT